MKSPRFERLVRLLKELFQLDKPDLDFGFYRIMHAKSDEVTRFLECDLLPQVKEAFSRFESEDRARVTEELKELEATAEKLGFDPDTAPQVQKLRRRRDEAVDIAALETDVYDHLYRFFRRYYSEGDFISQRVYKDGVYAIPYAGEEVKLHWANADQYYIKTTEYLRNYSFRLRPDDDADPMRVNFRLVDAAEGEHGNIKAKAENARRFILADGDFVTEEAGEDGVPELVVRFVFRPATVDDWSEDVRAEKKRPPVQKNLRTSDEKRILAVADPDLRRWVSALAAPHVKADGTEADYSRLRAHLNRYTARNTFDYFIHKDLRAFLRRELDFYIKNEVMRLDDIEEAHAQRVEAWLSKAKAIRFIAHKLIDFLAQLEDFQKKLWLKKKFVVETFYCITVGNIPDAFYPEIVANRDQHDEWIDLVAIDRIEGDLNGPGYDGELTPDFLRNHPTLMVDTRHFGGDFTDRLLEAMSEEVPIDDLTDGVLFHSENFQALRLMQKRYAGRIKCAYIDPFYNTEKDRSQGKFIYKDGYAYSSWLSMLAERIKLAWPLLSSGGGQYTSIDDVMYADLWSLMSQTVGRPNHVATIIWEKVHTRKNSAKFFSVSHDYVLLFARMKDEWDRVLIPRNDTSAYSNPDDDPRGPWKPDPVYANNPYDAADYVIKKPNGVVLEPPDGQYWRFSEQTWAEKVRGNAVVWGSETGYPMVKRYLADVQDGLVPVTLFDRTYAGDNASANKELRGLFGASRPFSYPKPSRLVSRLLEVNVRPGHGEWVLDYFAGSGSTAHAVIALNRRDGDRRRFVLVEMADYVDSVVLPRIKKVSYTPEWMDARPVRCATEVEVGRTPRIVKIVRLESYEDALNNLAVARNRGQQEALDLAEGEGDVKPGEDYRIRYMLDVETRGSRSLLDLNGFVDPGGWRMKVKISGTDEDRDVRVDLVETFNWLLGIRVTKTVRMRRYSATLTRDAEGRLRAEGGLVGSDRGDWWFRAVEGRAPDGSRVLIVWRNRPGGDGPEGVEEDKTVLNEWMKSAGYLTGSPRIDKIYVNGDHALESLRGKDDTWRASLIEDQFKLLMFDEGTGNDLWS